MKAHHSLTLAMTGIGLLLLSACGANHTSSPTDTDSPPAASEPAQDSSTAPGSSDGSSESGSADPSQAPKGDADGAVSPADLKGKWSADQKGEPFLEFDGKDKVIGTDGCNGINSTYSVKGSKAVIAPWVTTARGCTGVDTWLNAAATAEITSSGGSGDELTVWNKDGKEIGKLHKAAH